MKIPSDEIPQADLIRDVIKAVVSVSQGAITFQEIAIAINKTERQGRYYRKAAEIIGLISTPKLNSSVLTPLGRDFIATGATLKNPLLIQGVLSARFFQRLIPFFEANIVRGLTHLEIIHFIVTVSDLVEDSMLRRRLSSVISWLEQLRVIEKRGDRFFLSIDNINKTIEILNFNDIDEPVLPATGTLQEYQTVEGRISSASEIVTVYKDQARLERANKAHRTLVNLVAKRIREAGGIPKSNQFIDLATTLERDFIFEMKSTAAGNVNSQIRKGISQLYEYRYLENTPKANLILVIENPLAKDEAWMLDYMETDRDIHLIWDGNDSLYGSEHTRRHLPFLGIQAP
jgi:hypothetical protein